MAHNKIAVIAGSLALLGLSSIAYASLPVGIVPNQQNLALASNGVKDSATNAANVAVNSWISGLLVSHISMSADAAGVATLSKPIYAWPLTYAFTPMRVAAIDAKSSNYIANVLWFGHPVMPTRQAVAQANTIATPAIPSDFYLYVPGATLSQPQVQTLGAVNCAANTTACKQGFAAQLTMQVQPQGTNGAIQNNVTYPTVALTMAEGSPLAQFTVNNPTNQNVTLFLHVNGALENTVDPSQPGVVSYSGNMQLNESPIVVRPIHSNETHLYGIYTPALQTAPTSVNNNLPQNTVEVVAQPGVSHFVVADLNATDVNYPKANFNNCGSANNAGCFVRNMGNYAMNAITGTDYQWQVIGNQITTTLSMTTQSLITGAPNVPVLLALYPHQYSALANSDSATGVKQIFNVLNQSGTTFNSVPFSIAQNNTVSDIRNASTYMTATGQALQLIAGTSFTTSYNYPGVLPTTVALPASDTAGIQALEQYVTRWYQENKATQFGVNAINASKGAVDVNTAGKQLYADSNMVALLQQLANNDYVKNIQKTSATYTAMAARVAQAVTQGFDAYFAANTATATYFAFDNMLATVTGYPNLGGVVQQFDRHPETYGYFVNAYANLVANAGQNSFGDSETIASHLQRYLPAIEMIQNDYAGECPIDAMNNQGCISDAQQPFLRTWDAYMGHNWTMSAAFSDIGLSLQNIGESLSADAGLIKLGTATNNSAMVDLGKYLYTTELRADQFYWLNLLNNARVNARVGTGGLSRTTIDSLDPYAALATSFWPFGGTSQFVAQFPQQMLAKLAIANGLRTNSNADVSWNDIANTGYVAAIDEVIGSIAPAQGLVQYAAWAQSRMPHRTANGQVQILPNLPAGQSVPNAFSWLRVYTDYGVPVFNISTTDTPFYAVYENKTAGTTTYVFDNVNVANDVNFNNGAALKAQAGLNICTVKTGSNTCINNMNASAYPTVPAGLKWISKTGQLCWQASTVKGATITGYQVNVFPVPGAVTVTQHKNVVCTKPINLKQAVNTAKQRGVPFISAAVITQASNGLVSAPATIRYPSAAQDTVNPPQDLAVSNLSQGHVSIGWTAPSGTTPTDDIVYYYQYYTYTGAAPACATTTSGYAGHQTDIGVVSWGLTPNTNYEFCLLASYNGGVSAPISTTFATLTGIQPVNVTVNTAATTSSSIAVQWQQPVDNNPGALPITYQVTSTAGTVQYTQGSSNLTASVTGLLGNQTAQVTVTATDSTPFIHYSSNGSASQKTLVAQISTPNAPTISPSQTTGAVATARWNAVTDTNVNPNVTYSVTATPTTGTPITIPGSCSGTSCQANFTNLSSKTAYTVTVTATDTNNPISSSVSNTATSAPSNSFTTLAVPITLSGTPNVTPSASNGADATVTWAPAVDNNPNPNVTYTIVATPVTGGNGNVNGTFVNCTSTTCSATFSSLYGNSTYNVTVTATDTNNPIGSAANTASIQTKSTFPTLPVGMTAPTNVVATPSTTNGTDAAVTWSPAVDNNGGATVTYTATATPSGKYTGATVTAPGTCQGNTCSANFTTLATGVTYDVTVTANDAPNKLSATSSPSVSLPTKAAAITTPNITNVSNVTTSTVDVTWDASQDPNGDGTATVTYTATISGNGMTPAVLPNLTTTSANFTGLNLTVGDTYTVTVFATDSFDNPPSSDATQTFTVTQVASSLSTPILTNPVGTINLTAMSGSLSWGGSVNPADPNYQQGTYQYQITIINASTTTRIVPCNTNGSQTECQASVPAASSYIIMGMHTGAGGTFNSPSTPTIVCNSPEPGSTTSTCNVPPDQNLTGKKR